MMESGKLRWLGVLLLIAACGIALPNLAVAQSEPAAAEVEHEADVHAADAHSADAHATAGARSPLTFDPDLAWVTLVVFLGLLAFLWYFAWGPISQALDARERSITDNIRSAEAKHEEAKLVLAQHEAKLAMAKDEVRALLEEARRDADVTKASIIAAAETASREERERTVREIERARDGAVRHLAEQTANLAVDLAGRVVRQNLSATGQGELVNEAMTRLSKSTPSSN